MGVYFLTNEDDKNYIKSVNGVTPNESGDITIETSVDEIYILSDGETIEDAPESATIVINPNGYINIPDSGGFVGETVVTCDLEGSTEDENPTIINADALGGYLANEYTKAGYNYVDTSIIVGASDTSYAQCWICGNIAMITFDITFTNIPADNWYIVATSELAEGASAFSRFTNDISASAIEREFIFNGKNLMAFLVKSDVGKRFTGTMMTFTDALNNGEVSI